MGCKQTGPSSRGNPEQRRPSISAETMTEFARVKSPKYRMLLILAASAGCRIGELLGLEIKDLLDNFTTVRIIQQAKGKQLKTANAVRFVDISPEVAALFGLSCTECTENGGRTSR